MGAAAGAAAAAAAIAQAIKASGVLVTLSPKEFTKVLGLVKEPLVVHAEGGLFSTNYQYLVSYKGLAFFTKSSTQIPLPADCQVIEADSISIPG